MASIGWYIVATVLFIVMPALSSNYDKKLFWRISSLVLLASMEACLLAASNGVSHLSAPLRYGTHFSLLTHEAISLLHQAWITFNIALSQLPILSTSQGVASESTLVAQSTPLLQAMAMRTQLSSGALDAMLRKGVQTRHMEDNREVLNRLVDTMGRL